ncbi:hypothetical protein TNCV_1987381 [Trichonephila clavipes]|nr:hypothetical protein TNCV_1987381 [Trichonephila clavipes]
MMRYYFITSQSRWNIEICQRSCQGIRVPICPTAVEDNESVKSLRYTSGRGSRGYGHELLATVSRFPVSGLLKIRSIERVDARLICRAQRPPIGVVW